jgi:hypothetical protein
MLLLLSALGVVSPSTEYAGKRLAVVHGDGIRAGGISLAQEPGTRYIDSTRLLRRTTRLLAFRTDFSRFVIVDRIGLSIELIPHLFGANRRPSGERGMYAYWRNGSKVVDAGAFRVLLGLA